MAKFQKGRSGNPNGRAKGSRNRATMLVEQIFDEKLFGVDRQADAIINKVIEQAANGDTACIRLCFDRFAPARKDRPVYFALHKMQEAKDEQIAETRELERMGKPKPEEPQLQVQSRWLQRLFGFSPP